MPILKEIIFNKHYIVTVELPFVIINITDSSSYNPILNIPENYDYIIQINKLLFI